MSQGHWMTRWSDQFIQAIKRKALKLWAIDSKPQEKVDSESLLSTQIPAKRSRIVFCIFVVSLLLVVTKAFVMQCGFETAYLQRQGEIRVERTLPIPAIRGQVRDRNGQVLASSIPMRSIAVKPAELLKNAEPQHWEALAKTLQVPLEDIQRRVRDRQRGGYMYLGRQIEIARVEPLVRMRIPGVVIENEVKRNYPAGEIFSQIVGITNHDNVGTEAIELQFNQQLAGKNGVRHVWKDRMGRVVEEVKLSESKNGQDVYLSIDSQLQFTAFSALKNGVERFGAKAGSVIVADVNTGEILALANWPTYDPNNRRTLIFDTVRNRAITDQFEPGSTMKPFVVAKALDTGKVTPDMIVDTESGKLTIADKVIGDSHKMGKLTVAEVITKSSNIGVAKIALEFDPQEMYQLYYDLGFGQVPHIEFPGATKGRLLAANRWGPVEQATMAYGQGIAVSFLQLVRAYTSLARNGDVIDLTLCRAEGKPRTKPIYDAKVARQMRAIMRGTVERGGTARRISVEGYTVAGKTGTANKPENGVYSDKRYVSSFIGMTPAQQPRLIVAVMLDEPSVEKGAYYGGAVAAPIFNEVAANAMRLIGVNPDDPRAVGSVNVFVKGMKNE